MKNNITFYSNPLFIILLVLILLGTETLGLISTCFAQSPWTTKSSMPTARYVVSSSVVNGEIYAIGGAFDDYNGTSGVEAYDPVTDTWTSKANMPMIRAGGTSSTVNGRIYYMGGRPTLKGANISSVIEYDAATDTWTTEADTMPTPRSWLSSSGSVVDGKVYAIGGALTYQGAPLSTVEEYDPATDTWTRKADMPTARICVSTSVVNGKIYAIGGSPGSPWYRGLTTVEEYDPATDTWIRKADMPTGRTYFSTSVVNGKIYAIGGLTTGSNHFSLVEEYNPAMDTWRRVADDMPTARSGLATSVVNGKIYAIGGWVGSGTPISTVEEYDPSKDLTELVEYVYVNKGFVVAGSDSVCIKTKITDPTGITIFAEIEAPDQTPVDSLQLFDDGNHNDGNAGDSLYANVWSILSADEQVYYVDLDVTQIDTDTVNHHMNNMAAFTTIGPIVYESFTFMSSDTVLNPGDVIYIKVNLKNESTTASAINIKAKLSSLNELAIVTTDMYRTFNNIEAGESKTCDSYYKIKISEDCPDNTEIQFALDITSNDYSLWSDTFSVMVVNQATNVNTIENSPRQYSLDQNYPNPFNPSTTIKYTVGSRQPVTLRVYDILCNEIATLINEEKPSGIYEVEFDGSKLTSGIYFYQLRAGNFVQTKKLILMK
jgi:N-acetylneuraminic acid mutarotase